MRLRALPRSQQVAFVVIVTMFIGWIAYNRLTIPDSSQVVFRLERRGDTVFEDEGLAAELLGPLALDQATVWSAYCVNGWYWATDVTLDTNVVVATKERLVRAAELVVGGEYSSELAAEVEAELLADPDPGVVEVGDLSVKVQERFGTEALSRYLDSARQEPSAGATRRFVVYAVSVTLSKQSIYFIDLEHLDRGAIGRFSSMSGLGQDEVRVAGGTSIRAGNAGCRDLERNGDP